jgi:flagellar motor switch protein FliN/FliY
MADVPFDAASIAAAGSEHLAELTAALENCFEGMGLLEPGQPRAWEEAPEAFFGPGIAIRIETAGGTILGLLPASFPLPEWHLDPNDEETSRLAALANAWAAKLTPTDTTVERSAAEPADDLSKIAFQLANADSFLLPLNPEGCDGDTLRTIYVLACPAVVPQSAPVAPEAPAEDVVETFEPPQRHNPPRPAFTGDDPRRARLSRLLNVPIQVVVRLAEKKVELDQLLSLGPGSLITFDKNCEDLLDLYVNNRLYGRGEAVKIGEHFGIKIDEVGSVKHREERVF